MDLIKDLSAITDIKEYNLKSLLTLVTKLISHYVYCSAKEKSTQIDIDLGIAELIIYFENDVVKYKFIPSKELHNSIKKSFNSDEDLLIDEAIKVLGQRIEKTYKELL